MFQTSTPTEARALLDSGQGWIYLDVRSVEEFSAGHPAGAFNIPLAVRDPAVGGMRPNPEFVGVVRSRFAADTPLVVGCAVGGRSLRACEALAAAGFKRLVNMHGGFSGARDTDGIVTEAGWEALGFPVEAIAPIERTYDSLRPTDPQA